MPKINSILVLCEGNHCRSPIAEAVFQACLGSRIRVESAGLNALVDEPAHIEAVQLMAEQGMDISSHRGRQLTPSMALAADLILVMDQTQKVRCEQMIPSARGRVFLMGHWLSSQPKEIADPIRQGPEAFRSTFENIKNSVASWLPHMTPTQRSA